MISSAAVDDNKWVYWKPEIFNDIFARRDFVPLPPRLEALSLLKDFFENFNCMFPLFHEPTFMHLVDRHYSRDPYESSGWWASLNVALAIAHRLRVMSNLVPQEEDNQAWGYLKNALGVLTELTMRNTDLLSVQALLGMVRTTDRYRSIYLGLVANLTHRPSSCKERPILNHLSSLSPQQSGLHIALVSIRKGQPSTSTQWRWNSENACFGLPIFWTKSESVSLRPVTEADHL